MDMPQSCISCVYSTVIGEEVTCNLHAAVLDKDSWSKGCSLHRAYSVAEQKGAIPGLEQKDYPSVEKFKKELRAVLDDDFNFLVEKNRQYGDSALDPLRIFSQASTKEQIFVRMDDKLSRIKRGDIKIEDNFRDLRNYMNLLEVLERRERSKES